MTMTGKDVAALCVDAMCTLGEGPVWCQRRASLLWTDIEDARLWMHTPATGRTRSWALPDRVGAFVLCESGRVLLGLAKGLAFADIDRHDGDGVLPLLSVAAVEPDEPRTRINDGRTDRAGHFVFGTMNEAHAGGGRLGHFYQFSTEHGLRPLTLDPVAISNSLCFSPDGGTIYFADSLDRCIMQGDYDAVAARVSRVRAFVQFAPDHGLPDGSVVDSAGCLWNAAWAAGRVRRYAPDGRLDTEIVVDAINTTCPAFGGPSLTDLYITSSRQEMDAAALARQRSAGGVFHAPIAVPGLADRLFADGG